MNTIGPPQKPAKKSEHSTKSPNPVAALALKTTKLTVSEQSEKAPSKEGPVMNQNTSITDAEATFLRLHDVKDLVAPSGYIARAGYEHILQHAIRNRERLQEFLETTRKLGVQP